MSIENHPNFHACKFVSETVSSFYESLRGKASPQKIGEGTQEVIKDLILGMTEEIERIVDLDVEISGINDEKEKIQSNV